MTPEQKQAYINNFKEHCHLVLAWLWKVKQDNPEKEVGFIDMFMERSGEFVGIILDAAYEQWASDSLIKPKF